MATAVTHHRATFASGAVALEKTGHFVLRYGLVLVLAWIGAMKFTAYEATGIEPLIAHSPLMSWMLPALDVRVASGLIGVIEITLAILIALRPVSAALAAAGSAGATLIFLTTISFLFSTPGWEPSLGGFPGLSALPGQFLLKDVVLLGAALWSLGESLGAIHDGELPGLSRPLRTDASEIGWREQHQRSSARTRGAHPRTLAVPNRLLAAASTPERRIAAMKKLMSTIVILAVCSVATVILAQPKDTHTAPATGRQLPEYTKEGDLVLPKNWRSWIFLGSPITPDGLNDSKENFPEYHNVYIEPGSFDIYKKTGEFPEGTILFKELQRVVKPGTFPDGSRKEPSGRGYFPGVYNGADVTVKDTKRYADSGGWGYYNFNHHEPKAPTAKVKAESECAFCHEASAKKDDVWTQFYPMLDDQPAQ